MCFWFSDSSLYLSRGVTSTLQTSRNITIQTIHTHKKLPHRRIVARWCCRAEFLETTKKRRPFAVALTLSLWCCPRHIFKSQCRGEWMRWTPNTSVWHAAKSPIVWRPPTRRSSQWTVKRLVRARVCAWIHCRHSIIRRIATMHLSIRNMRDACRCQKCTKRATHTALRQYHYHHITPR